MNSFIPVSKPVFWGNERKYVLDCVDTSWISSAGKYINRFEELNTKFYHVNFAVAVSNGTAALHLALITLGIGPGDEVIVPGLTFPSSVNSVLHTGATPVLADIEYDSWTININQCEELVNEKTKAIMPVHLYGQPCDMKKVISFAKKHDLKIIEDCAEAHGAKYENKYIGSFGDINCFSFYGNKIVTCGEGGICLTNDEHLVEQMKTFRDHGMNKKKRYWHDFIGYNYRITNLQAAIGSAQMETIDLFNKKRMEIAKIYNEKLKNHPLITDQKDFADRQKVCWLYSILIDAKTGGKTIDQIRYELTNRNIDSRPFFYALNEMPIYRNLKHIGLKNSKTVSEKGLSLPTFADLTEEQIEYISTNLIEILDGR